MISCREAVERLWIYLDLHLEQVREEELEQHLGLCRHCCGELEFAKQMRDHLAKSAKPAAPEVRARLWSYLHSLEGMP